MSEPKITELPPGNYYGNLCIKEDDGKYYWSVEDWDDSNDWLEIDFALYSALLHHVENSQ